MKFAVVYEKGERNYSAYVPDLPGCVAAGDTLIETKKLIQEAIAFHLEGMLLDGMEVPDASSRCGYVETDLTKIQKVVGRKSRATIRR